MKDEKRGDRAITMADKRDLYYDKYYVEGNVQLQLINDYNSDNTVRLKIDEIKTKLLKLDYIREELKNWEDSKKLDESFKKRFPKINWYAITSLRNELAHNYRGIDSDIIWDIVQNYLNDLKHAFIDIFTQINKKGIKRELKKTFRD